MKGESCGNCWRCTGVFNLLRSFVARETASGLVFSSINFSRLTISPIKFSIIGWVDVDWESKSRVLSARMTTSGSSLSRNRTNAGIIGSFAIVSLLFSFRAREYSLLTTSFAFTDMTEWVSLGMNVAERWMNVCLYSTVDGMQWCVFSLRVSCSSARPIPFLSAIHISLVRYTEKEWQYSSSLQMCSSAFVCWNCPCSK